MSVLWFRVSAGDSKRTLPCGGGGGGGGVECSRSVSVSSFISEFVSASFLMHAIITWWLFTHSITSKLNKYFLSYRGLGGRPVRH